MEIISPFILKQNSNPGVLISEYCQGLRGKVCFARGPFPFFSTLIIKRGCWKKSIVSPVLCEGPREIAGAPSEEVYKALDSLAKGVSFGGRYRLESGSGYRRL